MSLLSSINNGRCLADEENDHNMLQDLQLAAELGKTLLERNKALENSLKAHQTTIEEQAQEIEYMKKQTAALREVNNSRLKIYEQLEVSIQDLERANRRLVVENTSDKKLIKSQGLTIENLETKSEELQKKIEELKEQCDNLRRQHTSATNKICNESQLLASRKASVLQDRSIQQVAARSPSRLLQETPVDTCSRQLASGVAADDEEVTDLLRQLHEARSQRAREQARVAELSKQLSTLVQENNSLEDQLSVLRNKARDMKNLQDEINALEEVRQGHLCGRCLRGVDLSTHDELSVMLDQEEDDDISMAESMMNECQRNPETSIQEASSKVEEIDETDSNPYRVLVEKYEALLEVQRQPTMRRKPSVPTPCMSLQEELEMSGEFNTFQNPSPAEYESINDSSNKTNGNGGGRRGLSKKPFSATPTDFSEAETSSSGFADETSNKSTQTDGRPGSLLCSIADGDDCKFSIYDDNSPFESRFRKTPEYRQLFSEIFSVLRRAAEAKDEGEKLPLLGNNSSSNNPKNEVSTDSPQDDLQSETTDDCQSVMSSMVSSIVSEPVFRVHTPSPPEIAKSDDKSKPADTSGETSAPTANPNGKTTENGAHHVRQPRRHHLDYLSINVQVRKKNTIKKNNAKKNSIEEHGSKTPESGTSPRAGKSNSSGNKRNRFRPLTSSEQADGTTWNGNTTHIFSSKTRLSAGNAENRHSTASFGRNAANEHRHSTSLEYKEYKPSTASEEVARLRRLEMSYADVLRMPNIPKVHNNRRY